MCFDWATHTAPITTAVAHCIGRDGGGTACCSMHMQGEVSFPNRRYVSMWQDFTASGRPVVVTIRGVIGCLSVHLIQGCRTENAACTHYCRRNSVVCSAILLFITQFLGTELSCGVAYKYRQCGAAGQQLEGIGVVS